MKRTLGILLVVISAAAVLSGCGVAGDPAAAKVGSSTISRSELDDELSALANNKAWVDAIGPNFGDVAAPKGGVSSKISAAWLSTLVNQYAIDQEFEKRDLTITEADRSAGERATLGLLASDAIANKFPRWFREVVQRRQERYAAVAAAIPPLPQPTEAQLQDLYSRIGAQICPTNVAVQEIEVATQQEADAIAAELAGGADFATLARERSTDRASGANSGLAACKDTQEYGELPEVMRFTISSLPTGSVSQPVAIDGAFRLFKVVPWSYEVGHELLIQLYFQQHVTAIQEFVSAQLVKTKEIWVDPRYGNLVRRGGTVVIYPNEAPTPRSKPQDPSSATTPANPTGQ